MTTPLVADFDDRKRQVRHYLATVRTFERLTAVGAARRAQNERLLTLRAGTFLLLYNLVEATTRATIEAIHDHITTKKVPFDLLVVSLRREIVKRFKRTADPDTQHTMPDLSVTFVLVAFSEGIKLGGNVDARLIRTLGEWYGFSENTTKARTWGGTDLLTVKSNRNDLAHGLKTFEEVGRDYTFRDLFLLSVRSIRYMQEIIANVASYLESEDYLEKPAT